MAAYPTSPAFKTKVTPLTQLRVQVAESGKVRGSSLSEETAHTIEVVHPLITSSEVSSLQTFYDTNRYEDNTIPASDGNTYDFWYQSDYTIEVVSATFFNARVTLVANRQ